MVWEADFQPPHTGTIAIPCRKAVALQAHSPEKGRPGASEEVRKCLKQDGKRPFSAAFAGIVDSVVCE